MTNMIMLTCFSAFRRLFPALDQGVNGRNCAEPPGDPKNAADALICRLDVVDERDSGGRTGARPSDFGTIKIGPKSPSEAPESDALHSRNY
jgi:hypothetical protein